MNKKVLTLCAGFLLAGGLVNFVSAENLKDYQSTDKVTEIGSDAYFLVMEQGGYSYAYGSYVDADNKIQQDVNRMGEENEVKFEDLNRFMWKVTEIELSAAGTAEASKTYGYALQNVATGKYLSIAANGTISFVDKYDRNDNTTYVVQNGFKKYVADTQWIPGTGSNYFVLNDTDNDAEVSSSTPNWTFNLYKSTAKEITDDKDLNELYNTTGFNLILNQNKWKDVENIFKSTRIRAIKVTNAESGDYSFPEGIYFVTKAPAGEIPTASEDLYDYLTKCTFIAASTTENPIAHKDRTEAGQGFALVEIDGQTLQKYTGTESTRQPQLTDTPVANACFSVKKNIEGDYALSLSDFYYVVSGKTTLQKKAVSLYVTYKDDDAQNDPYLTTAVSGDNFIFEFDEVFTQSAMNFLNEGKKAVYNIKFVNGSEDGKYLYVPAFEDKTYAKGAAFVDPSYPEAQYIVTNVDADKHEVTFTNRANYSEKFTAKLYNEVEGKQIYSLAISGGANKELVTPLNVQANGDIKAETTTIDLHTQWVELIPVSNVDMLAGSWDVDNLTEVTMLFARDNTPTSNKLYVHAANTALTVADDVTEALQFQLVKTPTPKYITQEYAYKTAAGELKYENKGDTIAYYTYKLQAVKEGQVIENEYLAWNSSKYALSATGDNFIIKNNVDGSVSISGDYNDNAYNFTQFIAVKNWEKTEWGLDKFEKQVIYYGDLTEEMKADYVKTYLDFESPETSLDPSTTYVTMKNDINSYYLAKTAEGEAILDNATTLRLFATDTDRNVPNFLVTTGWNETTGEREFLFNPQDSLDYYVANGEYNKKYQWDNIKGATKLIFKTAKLNGENAANDTIYTNIKGVENVAVSNVADNNKKVQAGLNFFKFQIVEDPEADGLYMMRQAGQYLASKNGRLTLDATRGNAIRFEIAKVDAPTANETINAANNNVVVAGVNGAVVVKGAEGKNVIVSTILGKVVANEVVSSDNAQIATPAGIVVVSVDGESFKVVVK